MSEQKTTLLKKTMLKALEKSLGVVKPACDQIEISRSTHYKWLKNDPQYKEDVENISEGSIDIAESKLYDLIEKGNITAIIFYLKTKGKNRGYHEKLDKDNNANESIVEGFKAIADALHGGKDHV